MSATRAASEDDLIAGAMRVPHEEKQELLEERDVGKRLHSLSKILARELEVVKIGSKIQSDVESEIGKGQREFFLRQQMKAIQDELGEGNELAEEMSDSQADPCPPESTFEEDAEDFEKAYQWFIS